MSLARYEKLRRQRKVRRRLWHAVKQKEVKLYRMGVLVATLPGQRPTKRCHLR